MGQQTTATTTASITVSRNISKTDEMRMDTEKFSLAASVKVTGGTTVTAIENGSITDRVSGMHLGQFTAYGAGQQNVAFQNVASREERAEIYEAVEDFIAGVTAYVDSEQTAQEG